MDGNLNLLLLIRHNSIPTPRVPGKVRLFEFVLYWAIFYRTSVFSYKEEKSMLEKEYSEFRSIETNICNLFARYISYAYSTINLLINKIAYSDPK